MIRTHLFLVCEFDPLGDGVEDVGGARVGVLRGWLLLHLPLHLSGGRPVQQHLHLLQHHHLRLAQILWIEEQRVPVPGEMEVRGC